MQGKLRKRIKVKYDPKVEATKPRGVAIRTLCDCSLANSFDEGKREWSLQSVIDETCDDFVGSCELCHTTNLKYNFVLFNPYTNKILRVGSTCIIRFQIIEGIVDVDSGVTLLQNFADEQYYINQLQTEVASMMVLRPDAKSLMVFHKNLKKVMELKNISNPTVDQIGEICYGNNWGIKSQDKFAYWRLKTIWENPASIDTVKAKVRTENEENAPMWYKKRRSQVYLPGAGRSNLYKIEREVIDNR